MMGIKDWVLSQLVSTSFASARPLSGGNTFFDEEGHDHELSIPGSAHAANLITLPEGGDAANSSVTNQENRHRPSSQQVAYENSLQSRDRTEERKSDRLTKIERLQIKFFRLLLRLGHSREDPIVAKVLYRMHLGTLIRAEEADLKRVSLSNNKARTLAVEQESTGQPDLDFSFRVLLLGRTGAGKSSTINSMFNQMKATTNAFQPATDRVHEISGFISGIKISFIDTPGLLPSCPSTVGKNRKILHNVKRFIRKHPPDMVLYFERLDLLNIGYSDYPLLKLVTEVFGSAIWFNALLVMTHSSSSLPEGPNGFPVIYESYLSQCKELVQHYIHQAVSDSNLENLVLFVENHPECKINTNGDRILPNGQIWRSQFLLVCICTKILGDINMILQFQDKIKLGISNNSRSPSLPHLLSSFLRHHISTSSGAGNGIDEISFSDIEEEEETEYDQLPPIRILTKTQFEKLTDSQKREYLDELDYRETVYMKKQLIEELRRKKENVHSEEKSFENQEAPEPVLLPDMAIPPSFDPDCPVYRYRCPVTNDQWLSRPVLDPHGWDHDVGFDGINLETVSPISKNVHASITGQFSKDKQDFNLQSECSASFVDLRGPIYSLGLDVQSSGKELIYTVHSSSKAYALKNNVTECGVSVTSIGKNYYVGAKLEDSILIGNRLKFVINGGRIGGRKQVAYGGSFGATLRGKDYPVRSDKVSLTLTVLSLNKDMVLGGNIESEFRLGRGTKMSVNANLNSRKMGQLSMKTSSSERMELALIALVAIFRGLLRRRATGEGANTEKLEMG